MADPIYESSANLPIGGKTFTIDSVVYAAAGEFSLNKPTREQSRRDQDGNESDLALWNDPITGSVPLQLATDTTPVPVRGETFVDNTVTYVITNVSEKVPQGDYWTVEISFRKPPV